ncbi:MFS transporter [Gordonia sp. DT219]|uniref:MFS transporter n=1 Tax=Gordonia sp. DT219 TaxID=3416658 RepID=UPI003CE9E2DE
MSVGEHAQVAAKSGAALFAAVFLFVFADSVVQTVMPVTLEKTGAASAGVIGLMIALPQGIGFISSLPAAAFGDARGRARMVAFTSLLLGAAGLAMACLVGASVVWWLLPVIMIGLTRLVAWVSILATVSTTGNPHVMQGLNGATQRGAAAVAAIVAAVVVASGIWQAAFVGVAVAMVALAPLTRSVLPSTGAGYAAGPHPREAYGFARTVVIGDWGIRASSLVAMCAMTVMTLGNSFFALTVDGSPHRIAIILVILLLARDVASILVGTVLPSLLIRLGIGGTVVVAGMCGSSGILMLAIPDLGWALMIVAAVLQGAAVCLCIGCTNLLAVNSTGGRPAGAGLRIAASNLIPCMGALLVPIAMGSTLQHLGRVPMFIGTALLAGGLGLVAWRTIMAGFRDTRA